MLQCLARFSIVRNFYFYHIQTACDIPLQLPAKTTSHSILSLSLTSYTPSRSLSSTSPPMSSQPRNPHISSPLPPTTQHSPPLHTAPDSYRQRTLGFVASSRSNVSRDLDLCGDERTGCRCGRGAERRSRCVGWRSEMEV